MHKDFPEQVPLQVMLAYGPLGLVRATSLNLAYDGMTVDTGLITLDEQSEVELSFTQRRHDEFVTHRIRARVSTSSRGTAVLTFSDYARTTWEALHHLIDGHNEGCSTEYTRSLPRLRIPAWLAPVLPPGSRLA